jgi:hypothetical protein
MDNVTKAPPGRIVYDPDDRDPHHRLGSDPAQSTSDIRIDVSPRWLDIQDALGIMPFNAEMRPIYDDHIVNICHRLSLSVGRADDFFRAHAVMGDVWGALQHAKIIVADCTGRNANVFYEMGVAHVLGKPVILTSQNKRDIPFDIGSIRYILYEYTPRGMKKFQEKFKAALLASNE